MHEHTRFFSGEEFSVSTCKLLHVNSESAMARVQLDFKGNGR